jgi:hypothetical protein
MTNAVPLPRFLQLQTKKTTGTHLHRDAACHVVAMPRSDQLARVGVSPEAWTAFRQAALAQGISVAAYLGRLVEAEVARREGRNVAGVSLDAPEPDQALAALAEVRASIGELDSIAGRLARSAAGHGAPWKDVGSSLRVSAEHARRAYGRKR